MECSLRDLALLLGEKVLQASTGTTPCPPAQMPSSFNLPSQFKAIGWSQSIRLQYQNLILHRYQGHLKTHHHRPTRQHHGRFSRHSRHLPQKQNRLRGQLEPKQASHASPCTTTKVSSPYPSPPSSSRSTRSRHQSALSAPSPMSFSIRMKPCSSLPSKTIP